MVGRRSNAEPVLTLLTLCERIPDSTSHRSRVLFTKRQNAEFGVVVVVVVFVVVVVDRLNKLLNKSPWFETPRYWCDYHQLGSTCTKLQTSHDDVIKWKHYPPYWPFVRGIHRLPVNSPHKGQRRVALVLSLIWAWTNSCTNNRNASDLRRHHAHYDVTVMPLPCC